MTNRQMQKFKINEIFYSLQGEGYFTGVPAVFVRFSGCNLKCPFCDTQHFNGRVMTAREIVAEVDRYPARLAVLTGGEPSLQVTAELVTALKKGGARRISMETNGTHPVADGVDWVTLSPKSDFVEGADVVIERCDELKLVYTGQNLAQYAFIQTENRFLQPCDTGDEKANRDNIEACVRACLDNPEWRLSLQTHKYIGIR